MNVNNCPKLILQTSKFVTIDHIKVVKVCFKVCFIDIVHLLHSKSNLWSEKRFNSCNKELHLRLRKTKQILCYIELVTVVTFFILTFLSPVTW